jgi:hypothetical protein
MKEKMEFISGFVTDSWYIVVVTENKLLFSEATMKNE